MGNDSKSGLLNTCPECEAVIDVSDYGPFEKIACPACGEAMRVRAHFNHFMIERKLGEGGMSQVFRARDLTLNRPVALKILNQAFTADEELAKRLETEARLTASINHPNVVKVYSVGEDQGYFYIAMELVEGRNLEEVIQEGGKMKEERVWEVAAQVAKGLRAAHHAGLIHRDIKPGNILLAEGEVAKIVDFGLALAAGRVDESKTIWVTPFYVPPEKLNDKPEDVRGDIYSLGATLYHAIAGRPPFDADTHSLEELKEIKSVPVSLEEAAPDAGKEACRVIDRMLERQPARRQPNYDHLLEEINALRALGERASGGKPEPYSQRTLALAAAVFFMIATILVYRIVQSSDDGKDISKVIESEVISGEPGDKGAGAVSSGGATKFREGRDLLLNGKHAKAGVLFGELVKSNELSWPTFDWAVYNAGLCALLQGDSEAARELFAKLESSRVPEEGSDDAELKEFFQEMAVHLRRGLPVMQEVLELERINTVTVMAWLAYGLKNWQDGRFEEAFAFFDAFEGAQPPQRLEWINAYKELLGPFKRDRITIARIPQLWSSMNLEQIEAVIAEFRALEGRLEVEGRGKRFFADRHQRALVIQEKSIEALKERERERLAAAKLKVEKAEAVELATLQDLLAEIKELRGRRDMEEVIEKLEAAEFDSEVAKRRIADELRVSRAANAFIDTVISDLNRYGYTGPIGRVGVPEMNGSISSASRSEVRVRLDLGGTVGEARLDFSALSIEGLLKIAREVLERVEPASDRKGRMEMLIFYSWLNGQDDYAAGVGNAFAQEDEEFRRFWEKRSLVAASAEENGP